MPDSLRGVALLGVALFCASCTDDDGSKAPAHEDAGTQPRTVPDGGVRPVNDASPGVPDVAVPDGGVTPPVPVPEGGTPGYDDAGLPVVTNTTFDTAIALATSGKRLFQPVVKPKQSSYFSFEGKAGSYYDVTTFFGPFNPDNVLSLYDPSRKLIGENDYGARWPGDHSVDARLVVRLPEDGTYYFRVQDPAQDANSFPDAYTYFFYYLGVTELTPGSPGSGFDGSNVTFAHDDSSGYDYATLVAELHDGTDSVFSFSSDATRAFIGQVLASGVKGNGGTAPGGSARVSTSAGAVIADIERDKGQAAIHPPIEAGKYTLTVTPAGDLGSNAFVAIDVAQFPENPPEASSDANDVITGAEPIAMSGVVGFHRGLILATLSNGDVDYYSFDSDADESIVVVCEGESGGSGIRSLHAEVRDANDAVIASAVETPVDNLVIQSTLLEKTGKHYLRLSTDAASAGLVDPWVRCVLSVGR